MKIGIVTGASSGLGREYVYLLDKENLDEIWLISRREKILKEISTEINTKVKIFALDLTLNDSIKIISKQLKIHKPNIKYLINSAGFGKIGKSEEISSETISKMIDLNCKAAILMTQIAIPFMAENSHIIEISSCSAFQPIPFLNIYASTKVFLLNYGKALAFELKSKKIFVSVVCPYWIKNTEFIGISKQTDVNSIIKNFPFAGDKKIIAKRSFETAKSGKLVITPDIISTVHKIFSNLLPDFILIKLSKLFHEF